MIPNQIKKVNDNDNGIKQYIYTSSIINVLGNEKAGKLTTH